MCSGEKPERFRSRMKTRAVSSDLTNKSVIDGEVGAMKLYDGLQNVFAVCLAAAAVAPLQFDNGPDPVSDGMYRIVDEAGRIGYADEDGRVVIEPQFAFGMPFVDGSAFVANTGIREEVSGSGGEYHRWSSKDWFCIDKTGRKIQCTRTPPGPQNDSGELE